MPNRPPTNPENNTAINPQQARSAESQLTQPSNSTREEIDERENKKILASLMAASENEQGNSKANIAINPRNKHMDAHLPLIHMDSPAALLEGIDKDLLISTQCT